MIRLASSPAPHSNIARSPMFDIFRSRELPTMMARPTPAPAPVANSDSNEGPNASWREEHGHIPAADWDVLFQAIQTRLETCVSDALHQAAESAPHDRHAQTKKSVLECVEAMRQLQASLTLEREKSQTI